MAYKKEDWQRAQRRLQSARESYSEYKNDDADVRFPDRLDDAIIRSWTFGEYAINVCLESFGLKVPQNHSQAREAKSLFELGKLSQDYSEILAKLEQYRKKASHLGYTKERSVHYSSADVDRCLTKMEELSLEVDAILERPTTK